MLHLPPEMDLEVTAVYRDEAEDLDATLAALHALADATREAKARTAINWATRASRKAGRVDVVVKGFDTSGNASVQVVADAVTIAAAIRMMEQAT